MVSVEFHQRAQRSTCVGDMPTLLANAHMKRFYRDFSRMTLREWGGAL
jgi:hypothetical protein